VPLSTSLTSCFLALALAACKFDPLPEIIDAATVAGDAGTDADIDAPPRRGDLTVIVTDHGAPAVAIPVLFHGPDGHWIATERTDSNGLVIHEVAAGDAITVIMEVNSNPAIRTIFGVEPGDELSFRLPAPVPEPDVARILVSWTAPDVPCAMDGEACYGYGTAQNPAGFGARPSCLRGSEAWFALKCGDRASDPYFFGKVDLIGGTRDYSMTLDASAFSTSHSTTSVAFAGAATGISGSLSLSAGFSGFFRQTFYSTPQSTIWNRTIPLINDAAYREQASVLIAFGGTHRGGQGYVLTTALPRNGVTEDLSDLPPAINVLEEVTDVSGAQRLTWAAAAPVPMSVDGIIIGHGDGFGYAWDLILPPSATSAARPELPEEFAAYRNRLSTSSDVRMLDASDLSGYADFRSGRHPVRDYGDFAFELTAPVGPAVGTRWNWGAGRIDPI